MNAHHNIASDKQTQPVRIAGQRRDSLTGRMVRVVSRHGNDLVMSDAMRVIESLNLDGRRVVALAYECEVEDVEPSAPPRPSRPKAPDLSAEDRQDILRYRHRFAGLTWRQIGLLFGISSQLARDICQRDARLSRGERDT